MSPLAVGVTLGLSVLVLAGVRWAFKKDDKVENRRKLAIRTGANLRGWGFDDTARLCEAYAVGDYSGVLKEMEYLREHASNPEKFALEVKHIVLTSLPRIASTNPAMFAEISGLIESEQFKAAKDAENAEMIRKLKAGEATFDEKKSA